MNDEKKDTHINIIIDLYFKWERESKSIANENEGNMLLRWWLHEIHNYFWFPAVYTIRQFRQCSMLIMFAIVLRWISESFHQTNLFEYSVHLYMYTNINISKKKNTSIYRDYTCHELERYAQRHVVYNFSNAFQYRTFPWLNVFVCVWVCMC